MCVSMQVNAYPRDMQIMSTSVFMQLCKFIVGTSYRLWQYLLFWGWAGLSWLGMERGHVGLSRDHIRPGLRALSSLKGCHVLHTRPKLSYHDPRHRYFHVQNKHALFTSFRVKYLVCVLYINIFACNRSKATRHAARVTWSSCLVPVLCCWNK